MPNDKEVDRVGKLLSERIAAIAKEPDRVEDERDLLKRLLDQSDILKQELAKTDDQPPGLEEARRIELAEAFKRQAGESVPTRQIVKFIKTGKGSPLMPTQGHIGDAGWDLYTSRPIRIEPGSFVDAPCDIRMELPPGYWARITGRSSTIRKFNLMVAEGVIDNGYRGELFTGIWNLGREVAVIPVHSRLAQLILHPLIEATWMEVGALGQSTRGTNGFGSTGRGA